MLKAGEYTKLKVMRKSDLGYMLTNHLSEEDNENDEVLMHFRQAAKEYNDGEVVNCFIYYDKQNRYCATSKQVNCTLNKIGKCKVVEVVDDGVFLDNNTSKDIFLSKDFLPYDKSLWPNVDDELFAILKHKENQNKLVCKGVTKELLNKYKNKTLEENSNVDAIVMFINNGGYLLCDDNFNPIFVPFKLTREKYHIGSKVNVKITKVSKDIYGSLVENKEKLMLNDKDIIINYLKEHKNFMPFTAKSSSESIERIFKISRKAFKRAYGQLYKEELIYFDEKGTYLK